MSQSVAPMVLKVNAIGPGLLLIEWLSGESLQTDISEQIKRFKLLHPLRDAERFAKVAPGLWGHSVTWGGDIELGADLLYELGRQQGGNIGPVGFNPLFEIDATKWESELEPGRRLHWAELGEDAWRALDIMNGALAYWDRYKRPQPDPTFIYDYTPGSTEAEAASAAFDAKSEQHWTAPYWPEAYHSAIRIHRSRLTARQRMNDFKSMAAAVRWFAQTPDYIDDSAIYALLALIDANEAIKALAEVPRLCMSYLQEACGEDADLSLLLPELKTQRHEYAGRDAENRLYAVRLLGYADKYLLMAGFADGLNMQQHGHDNPAALAQHLQDQIDDASKNAEKWKDKAQGRSAVMAMNAAKGAFYAQADHEKWLASAKSLLAAGKGRRDNGRRNIAGLAREVAKEHSVAVNTMRNFLTKNRSDLGS